MVEREKNEWIGIEMMNGPSEYLEAESNVYDYEEEGHIIKDKIVIGNIFGGCLLLGCQGHNMDHVFADKLAEDSENRCIKIADNILEYFRKIIIQVDFEALKRHNIELNNLSRKWNDEGWSFQV